MGSRGAISRVQRGSGLKGLELREDGRKRNSIFEFRVPMVQRCFSSFTGMHTTPEQWGQAARGFAQAGLGLRSCAVHAAAAYLASVGSSLKGCAEIYPAFSATAVKASQGLLGAWHSWQGATAQAQSLEAVLSSYLSQQLDAAGWDAQLRQASAVAKASLQSEAGLGARAFLNAVPCGGTRMEPAGFFACVLEWLTRLKMAGAPVATACWIAGTTTLACVWREGSALSATMLCAMWFTAGRSEQAFNQSRRPQAFCSHSVLRIAKRPGAAPQMSTFPPWRGVLLHWISP
ncbi:unnamed protein product [Symbiodinium natans]|uniref:Uncharacterized protein n=1 Tax=Symbiodinium natans TaxID=878477 RepID=A0A812S2U6_9DINO|nr:unnamed protein product [Symbiodinium natans]